MSKWYFCNALSLNMLPDCGEMAWRPSTREEIIKAHTEAVVAIGHADLARILGVSPARITVEAKDGDRIVVAQYRGPRLPEGCVELPHGARIDYITVFVH